MFRQNVGFSRIEIMITEIILIHIKPAAFSQSKNQSGSKSRNTQNTVRPSIIVRLFHTPIAQSIYAVPGEFAITVAWLGWFMLTGTPLVSTLVAFF